MMKKNDTKKESVQTPEKTEQIKKLQAEIDELTDRWKRALADYQNLEKRINEEKVDFVKFAAASFIKKLLDIVDDLEKAQTHLKDEGLGLTLKKLYELLKDHGVKKIDVLGKEFDISTMEAVAQSEGEKENLVVGQLRAGYTMHGAVLRPAQVVVSKKA